MSAISYLFKVASELIGAQEQTTTATHLNVLDISPHVVITPEFIELLQKHRLLQREQLHCPHMYNQDAYCDKKLELRESKCYNNDGYEYYCPTHGGHISIRTGSWFAHRRLSIGQLLYIFHLLSSATSSNAVKNFLAQDKIHRTTVTSILHDLQHRMWLKLCANHIPTFTPADELEIDEMWLDWKKPENGGGPALRFEQWESGRWLIGLIDRKQKKLWIECIPNRKKETIQKVVDPMLKRWLFRYPRVYTDALKSYEYLEKENTHYVINKQQDGFGIQQTTFWGHTIDVNVNHIENLWMQLRKHLSMRHAYSAPQFIQLHVAEFMYIWYKLDWWDLITLS